MEILVVNEAILNGFKQKMSKMELLEFIPQGQIKPGSKKSCASVSVAIPDEWASQLMNFFAFGKEMDATYFVCRIEKEKAVPEVQQG